MSLTYTYLSLKLQGIQASILLATTETRSKFDQSLASILILENKFGARRVLG
jgi:hypothetical protein